MLIFSYSQYMTNRSLHYERDAFTIFCEYGRRHYRNFPTILLEYDYKYGVLIV